MGLGDPLFGGRAKDDLAPVLRDVLNSNSKWRVALALAGIILAVMLPILGLVVLFYFASPK
jgi:hypothetical protein